ncbi:hypothetical protein FHT74_006015 [Rhizobium sp. BK109]|nr:hypothetical protein [Rhizobium sp. BK109]
MERAAEPTFGCFAIAGSRLVKSLFFKHLTEGIYDGVQPRDARQAFLNERFGRELAGSDC